MCSHFFKMMENYQGDLADIVRATATTAAAATTPAAQASTAAAAAVPDWQFSRNSINCPPEYFGDPFSYTGDPLTQNIATPPVSELFYSSSIANGGASNISGVINHKVVDDEMKRPSNIFSRMLQISPNAKLQPCDSRAAAAPSQRELKNLVSNNGSLICPSNSGLQISSPPNTGTKRRKSQARKVVCIPAPAPANSRATGEVVPSDLWAWRKYGQKPIKGSPYPRGYYRCSSSKGCSARKQVERSRTDPNMLVITYTSEHNHPWPTQRNALAGSTRSQAAKNSSNNKDSDEKPTKLKQHHEQKETSSPLEDNCGAVKELDNQFEAEFNEGFPATYKPTLADSSSNHEQDSFFAYLGEIGDDPLNLFGQGFPRDNNYHSNLDLFSFYDWATTTAATTAEVSGRKS